MEKTPEQLKAERIEELKKFDFSKRFPNLPIEHAQKEVIKFTWRNKSVDLRTCSESIAKAVAADPYSKVLVEKSSGAKSSPETTGKASEKK